MAGVGEIIAATDYNTIRSKIALVMSTGAGTYGYGQTINSSEVAVDERVTKLQWDNLRYDIVNAIIHQTGTTPTITTVSTTDPIRYGASHPNYQYNTLAEQAKTFRFDIGSGQFSVVTGASTNYTSAWSSSLNTEATVTFGTVDSARFFFNSGGKIRFVAARTGGSATNQNSAWTNLLTAAGSVDFGGNSPTVNFYTLTNSYQTFYTSSSSSPYSANSYALQAKCNVADNSGGTANIVYFRIVLTDNYTDPGTPPAPDDSVDGTLSLTIYELKAAGPTLPTGSFSITSPSYSLSAFTGS